jgi:hypothetical protein
MAHCHALSHATKGFNTYVFGSLQNGLNIKAHKARCEIVAWHMANDSRGLVNELAKIDPDGSLGFQAESVFELLFFLAFAYHYAAITSLPNQLAAYQMVEFTNSQTRKLIKQWGKVLKAGWLERSLLRQQLKARVLEYRALMKTQASPILSGKEMVYPLVIYLVPDVAKRSSSHLELK